MRSESPPTHLLACTASLTVSSVELDSTVPYATLKASDEKNRKGSEIPLRADLATDLRQWLRERENETCDVMAIGGDNVVLLTDAPLLSVTATTTTAALRNKPLAEWLHQRLHQILGTGATS